MMTEGAGDVLNEQQNNETQRIFVVLWKNKYVKN